MLASEIAERGLNVRAAESLAQASKGKGGGKSGGARGARDKDPDTKALERDLAAALGLKVEVDFRGQGGALTIHYRTLDQLDDVLRRLQQAPTAK
jgi:ParB family chromosome partitioning protein